MTVHSRAIINSVEASEYVANEIPSGLVNSTNTVYTLSQTPIASSISLYLNGLLQIQGSGEDYTVSGNTITFEKAPRVDSEITATYIFNS